MIAHSFATVIGDEHLIFSGLLLGLLQSYLNTILIFRVGKDIYADHKTAELAAYLYIASHSALYQITFYSENTFLMFSLFGFLIIYSTPAVTQTQSRRTFHIPRSSAVLLAGMMFGMSTLTRSTGILLSIFIAFFLGNSFLVRYNRIGPAVKTVCSALLCIVIMFAPLIIIIYI